MIDFIALSAGALAATAAIAALAAAMRIGWTRGYSLGFDEGYREHVIEDETIDAEWEERDISPGIAHLMRGKAPIRKFSS